MITIAKEGDLVTLINVFSCEPQNQERLIDSWVRATEERLGKLPGIISAALHRSKDGTRVVNYAQWKSAEDWANLTRIGSLLPAGQDRRRRCEALKQSCLWGPFSCWRRGVTRERKLLRQT